MIYSNRPLREARRNREECKSRLAKALEEKNSFTRAIKGLKKQSRERIIDSETFKIRLEGLLGTKTEAEWLKLYDRVIDHYRIRISEIDSEISKIEAMRRTRNAIDRRSFHAKDAVPIVAVILLLSLFGLFVMDPAFLGMVTHQQSIIASDNISLSFTENGSFTWIPSRDGMPESLTISGRASVEGSVAVWLEYETADGLHRLLVLNSTAAGSGGLGDIVGYSDFNDWDKISDSNNDDDIGMFRTAEGDDMSSTGAIRIAEGSLPARQAMEINLIYSGQNDDDDYEFNSGRVSAGSTIGLNVNNSSLTLEDEHLCTVWTLSNGYSECYGSAQCCSFVETGRYGEEWDKEFTAYYGLGGIGIESNVSAQIWYVDYDLSVPYSDVYSSAKMQLPISFYYRSIDFEDACIDTCSMLGYADSLIGTTEFTIIVEVNDGRLDIESISYTVPADPEFASDELIQGDAEIGKPVKWTKKIMKDVPGQTISEITRNADNITAYEVINGERRMLSMDALESALLTVDEMYTEKDRKEINKIEKRIAKELEKLSGEDNERKAQRLQENIAELTEELDSLLAEINERYLELPGASGEAGDIPRKAIVVEIGKASDHVEIEYYTASPTVTEKVINEKQKEVVISSPEHLKNIKSYASLPSEAPKHLVNLFWIVNGSRIEIKNITLNDTNGNGLADWIEWMTPHLSNQTFLIEIRGGSVFNWSMGTYMNTTFDGENITLDMDGGEYYGYGEFISEVMDMGYNLTWRRLSWLAPIPYGVPLPGSAGSETMVGGVDMAGNVLLFNMEDDDGVIADASGSGNDGKLYGTTRLLMDLNSNNGTHVFDRSSYGHHGVISGGVDCNVTGIDGNACEFDGIGGYVEIPSNPILDITEAVTLNAWVKMDDLDHDHTIITKGISRASNNNNSAPWHLSLISQGGGVMRIQFRITDNEDRSALYADVEMNVEQWYHIVGVWDGTTDEGAMRIYLDGVMLGSGAPNNNVSAPLYVNELPVVIGGDIERNNFYFNGSIDEVAIYAKALSEDDIASLYAAEKARFAEFVQSNGNMGLSLDGINDYIAVPDDDSLDFGMDDFSVTMWIEPYEADHRQGLLGKRDNPGQLLISYQNLHQFLFYITDGTTIKSITANNNPPGHKYHLAFIGNRSGNMQIFVDGELKAETDITTVGNISGDNVLEIGSGNIAIPASGHKKLNGTIDDIAIYSRALSADEVMARYLRGASKLNIIARGCAEPDCSDRADDWDISCADVECNLMGAVSESRFFQYRAILSTEDKNITPYLMGVNLEYGKTEMPYYSNFDTTLGTTDFMEVENLENVENMTLANDKVKVVWQSTVNASFQDFDSNTLFQAGIVSINATALDPSINTSAYVTLTDTDCNDFKLYYSDSFEMSRFSIEKDGLPIADNNDVGYDCIDDSICRNITCSSGNLTFLAMHFDSFGVGVIKWTNATSPVIQDQNVYIDAEFAQGNYTLDKAIVGITAPGENEQNFTMSNSSAEIYYYDGYSSNITGEHDYMVYLNDTDGNTVSSGGSFIVEPGAPDKVTLISPENDTFGFDFRPTFNWSAVDGENITYKLHLVRIGCYGMSECANAEVLADGITATEYTIEEDLDLDSPYEWYVTANNSYGYGEPSDNWTYTVQSLVDITLVQSTVSLGGLEPGDEASTEPDGGIPLPFIIQNNGNVFVNISINATGPLWMTKGLDSEYFRFKARENLDKQGSFNMTMSAMDWLNTSYTARHTVAELDYNVTRDYANIDIAIKVPESEPPGERSTDLTIHAVATRQS